jgi:hypothetical protein
MVLRNTFGPKNEDAKKDRENCIIIIISFMICTPNDILVLLSKRMRWAEHVVRKERTEIQSKFWRENQKEEEQLGDTCVD